MNPDNYSSNGQEPFHTPNSPYFSVKNRDSMTRAALTLGILSISTALFTGIGGIIFGGLGILMALLSHGKAPMKSSARTGILLSVIGIIAGLFITIFTLTAIISSYQINTDQFTQPISSDFTSDFI